MRTATDPALVALHGEPLDFSDCTPDELVRMREGMTQRRREWLRRAGEAACPTKARQFEQYTAGYDYDLACLEAELQRRVAQK